MTKLYMAKKTADKKPRVNPDEMFKELDALKEQTQPKEADAAEKESAKADEPASAKGSLKARKARARGKKYQEKRSLVDKTKSYPVAEAVELLKKMSYSRFVGTVEAHLQVKDAGVSATFTYPHSTGKSVRAAIVNEEIIENLTKGIIDFDILIARPEDMKNIAKFARILGPKGLMPNPKNGTVTPTPDKRKKELEAGAITLKTEKKAPLVHTTIGKLSMDDAKLVANVEALLKAFENKAVKLYLCASMSPSVRVSLQS